MFATRWRVLVAVAGLASAACSNGLTAPSRPAPKVAPGIWVSLGTSTTAGFIVSSPSRAWVPRLQAAVESRGVAIFNLAVAGSITPQSMPANTPAAAGRPAPLAGNNIDGAMRERPTLVLLNATNNGLHPNDAGDAIIFEQVDAVLQSGRCVAPHIRKYDG